MISTLRAVAIGIVASALVLLLLSGCEQLFAAVGSGEGVDDGGEDQEQDDSDSTIVVEGTITVESSDTSSGTLLVALSSSTHSNDTSDLPFAEVPYSGESTVDYRIEGVTPGSYFLLGFVDTNDNGIPEDDIGEPLGFYPRNEFGLGEPTEIGQDTVWDFAIRDGSIGNSRPEARISVPSTVEVGSTFELDGTGSSDPDGDGIFYQWSIESAPSGSTATLSDASDPTPSFSPDVAGDYTIALSVSDGNLADSATRTVSAIEASPDNSAPTAVVGVSQQVEVGSGVTADGSDSSDPEGDALTYTWSLVSVPEGSSAGISDSGSASVSFTPDVAGDYTIELEVSDGELTDVETATVSAEGGSSAEGYSVSGSVSFNETTAEVPAGIIRLELHTTVPEYLDLPEPSYETSVQYDGAGESVPYEIDGINEGNYWLVGYLDTDNSGMLAALFEPFGYAPAAIGEEVALPLVDQDVEWDLTITGVATVWASIYIEKPNSNFWSENVVFVDELLEFSSGGSGMYGPITEEWDLDDGTTKTESSFTHSYSATGTYTVTLTVTDRKGNTDTATREIEVVSSDNGVIDIGVH